MYLSLITTFMSVLIATALCLCGGLGGVGLVMALIGSLGWMVYQALVLARVVKQRCWEAYYVLFPNLRPVVHSPIDNNAGSVPIADDLCEWFCTYPTLESMVGYAALFGIIYTARDLTKRILIKGSKEASMARSLLWTYVDAGIAVLMVPVALKLGLSGAAMVFSRLRLFVAYLHTVASGVTLVTSSVSGYSPPVADALVRLQDELEERENRLAQGAQDHHEPFQPNQLKPGLCAALGYSSVEEASAKFQLNAAQRPAKGAKVDGNRQGLGYIDSHLRMGMAKLSWMRPAYAAVGGMIVAVVFLLVLYYYAPTHLPEGRKKKKKIIHVSGGTTIGKRAPDVSQRDVDELPSNQIEPDQPHTMEPLPIGARWGDYETRPTYDKTVCFAYLRKGKCNRQQCAFAHIAPCKDSKCGGSCPLAHRVTKRLVRPHVSRESKFDNPIVPVVSEHAHAYVETAHAMSNAVLVSGWWFVPYHLVSSLDDGATITLVRLGVRYSIDRSRVVRCDQLDLAAFQVAIAGTASLKVAIPTVGDEVFMWAWLDGKRTMSHGHVLSVDDYQAAHNVSTVAGHCCGALVNKHGHIVGFHILGGTTQNVFIPLSSSVQQLIKGLKA